MPSTELPSVATLVGLQRTFDTVEEVVAAGYGFSGGDNDYHPTTTAVVKHRNRWYRGVITGTGDGHAVVAFVTPAAVTRSEQHQEPIRATSARAPFALVAVAIPSLRSTSFPIPSSTDTGNGGDRRRSADDVAGRAFARIIAGEAGRVARPAPHENPRMWARARLAELNDVVKAWNTILVANPGAPDWARYAVERQVEAARHEVAFLASLIG